MSLHELAARYAEWGEPGETAGVRILDTLAALRRGAATGEGRAIAGLADASVADRPVDGGVLGTVARRVSIARLTELDDIHMASGTTPGAVVVPTAVTLGAALGVSAGALARAVEIGYDALVRLGLAIDGARAVYRGVWPTYFGAPFAAAATVAALLELDARRTAHALGLALTRATGLTSGIAGAPLGRWLTVGDAAGAGCLAAVAAGRGFLAEVDIDRVAAGAGVELDRGFLAADDVAAVDAVSVKPFPIAKQSLAATLAALALADRVAGGEAGTVRVHVPSAYAPMVARAADPASRLSRLSSARWNVALALAWSQGLADVERSPSEHDDRVRELAERVEVLPDEELSAEFPRRWPARVTLGDGGELVVLDAFGDPPGNGRAAVIAKWARLGDSLAGLDARSPRELDAALPIS